MPFDEKNPVKADRVLQKKGVHFPCPVCEELVPMVTDKWQDVLWDRAGLLIKIAICIKCFKIIKRDAEREIKNSKVGESIRIHRGKIKL